MMTKQTRNPNENEEIEIDGLKIQRHQQESKMGKEMETNQTL